MNNIKKMKKITKRTKTLSKKDKCIPRWRLQAYRQAYQWATQTSNHQDRIGGGCLCLHR